MIRLGKTYGNLMVDLRATNNKLRDRSGRIVSQITGLDRSVAVELLERCDGEVKTAILVQLGNTTPQLARQQLQAAGGHLRTAISNSPAGDSTSTAQS
jgi:N-acetylmuramic acid 6-phosphate etherase